MQHVHRSRETDGINGAVSISVIVVDDLEHAATAEPSERFGEGCLEAQLRIPKRPTDTSPNFLRAGAQIVLAAADPAHRLWLLRVTVSRARHLFGPVF